MSDEDQTHLHFYLFLVEPNSPDSEDFDEHMFLVDAYTEIKAAKNFKSVDEYNSHCETLSEVMDETFDPDVEQDKRAFQGMSLRAQFNAQRVIGPLLVKTEFEMTGRDMQQYLDSLSRKEAKEFFEEAKITKDLGSFNSVNMKAARMRGQRR